MQEHLHSSSRLMPSLSALEQHQKGSAGRQSLHRVSQHSIWWLCRTLSENKFTGTLPVEWSWTPSFSLLRGLYLDRNSLLSATLPTAWGANGAFSSLQVCCQQHLYVIAHTRCRCWCEEVTVLAFSTCTSSSRISAGLCRQLHSLALHHGLYDGVVCDDYTTCSI